MLLPTSGIAMELHFQCNLSDYDEALKAQRSSNTTKVIIAVGFALVFASEVIAVNLGVRQGVASVVVIAFTLTLSLIIANVRPHWIRKDFQNHPNFQRQQTVLIGDDGLHWRSEVSHNDTFWSAYTAYRETTNLFLLYLGKRLVQVVPKRALSEADLKAFRELLQQKLTAKSSGPMPTRARHIEP